MRTQLFDYRLPPERVAQRPAGRRELARMLTVTESALEDDCVGRWADRVPAGALVIVNETKVDRARLVLERPHTGGKVEVFLLRRADAGEQDASVARFEAMTRANRPLSEGDAIGLGDLKGRVLGSAGENGTRLVELEAPGGVDAALDRYGQVPLPPYIKRPAEPEDLERYQTVFARERGSVAAPTAGLHLSQQTFARLEERGVAVGRLTLHVGLGTFRPVRSDDLDGHPMHAEWCDVGEALVEQVRAARRRSRPVVAVGTTVVRALESAAEGGSLGPMRGETRLLIQPGYRFRVVDALLTNFHAPRSTLVALVAAFAGRERTLAAYDAALDRGYRFLSYGDAMWIPRRLAG